MQEQHPVRHKECTERMASENTHLREIGHNLIAKTHQMMASRMLSQEKTPKTTSSVGERLSTSHHSNKVNTMLSHSSNDFAIG